MDNAIYLGTILLEKNRWTAEKQPTYRVGDWMDRIAADGFDGLELWQWHATTVDDGELKTIDDSPLPISIFNSYAAMDDVGQADRAAAVNLVRRLGSLAVKYNVGNDVADRKTEMANLAAWREAMPDEVCLLCECHPGTYIEEAADAKRFFDELKLDNWGVIVHAFNRVDSLKQWFDLFEEKVGHAHLQMRDDQGTVIRFDRDARTADKALKIMQAYGFAGSMTLEFTEGTRADDENIDTLYDNALADLKFLRERLD